MTAVSPPPNWYADPTGRHDARYWDGFTWTAHVADRGSPGIDPLVRADPLTAQAPDAVGPGTAQLRAMAAARPAPTRTEPVGVVAPRRRRSLAHDLSAVVALVIVVAFGGYALWTHATGSDTTRRVEGPDPVTWSDDRYGLALPANWVVTEVPDLDASPVDAVFQIVDQANVIALVAHEARGLDEIPDADSLLPVVTDDVESASGIDGTTAHVVSTEVLTRRDRLIGVVVVDVRRPDGRVLAAIEHVVVGREGSVALLLLGEQTAVERHADDALTTARSVMFE